eukprot:SAG31_NODE_15986_length_728_cov_1.193959_1_plen_52_part_00
MLQINTKINLVYIKYLYLSYISDFVIDNKYVDSIDVTTARSRTVLPFVLNY